MNPYTIILLYPDYSTDTFGQNTYIGWTMADNVEEAIRNARVQCNLDNGHDESEEPLIKPEDLFVIAAFLGHNEDINPGDI